MRKTLTFLLLGAVLNNGCKCKKDDPVTPEPPVVTEEQVMGKVTHNGDIIGSISSKDGNILAYGSDASDSTVLMKISMSSGAIMWSKRVPSTDMERLSDITELSDGVILAAGVEKLATPGMTVVIAYHPNGEQKWRKVYGDTRGQVSTNILLMKNGKVMLTASHNAAMGSGTQYELSRYVLDTDGNEISRKDLGYNKYTVYNRLAQQDNNSVVQMGTIINMPGDYTLHFIKMDGTGEILTQQEISKAGASLSGHSVKELNGGELICIGSHRINTNTSSGFVLRLSSSLSENSYTLFSDNDSNVYFNGLLVSSDGYSVVGGKMNTATNKMTSYMMKCAMNNDVTWEKNYSPTNNRDERLENIWMKSSNFVVLGASNAPNDGKYFLMGLDKNGNPK